MECYLAGATDTSIAGEHPIKNGKAMELYLAGENGKTKAMELYLAGENGKTKAMELWSFIQKIKSPLWDNISILESFFYVSKNKVFPTLLKKGIYKKILLDSGAFTFMQSSKTNINWEDYINQYANFINANDIKLFFELDIDGIIGLDNVERLRDRLYRLTGKQPIPVWHINRGKQYFIDMCKTYPYVALGGIAGAGDKATRRNAKKYFPWFINTAHKNNAKIHGLGFTEVKNLKIYHFDSVDSTAWLYGNRGGYIYRFNTSKCEMEQITKENSRLKGNLVAIYNFNEWLKFQDYARKYL